IVYFLISAGTAIYWVALVGILFLGLTWLAFNGSLDATILENNIVQTAGSAGESIAFGVGVTMPAIMILGLDLEVTRVMLVALLGGLLGILMMIPLRRALIVAQHGDLKYPEGTACAEVLKAGVSGDQVFRIGNDHCSAAWNNSHQRDESVADSRRLHFVHRRGRGCRRRNNQPVSIFADNLAWLEGRACRSSGRTGRDCWRSPHRSRHVYEGRHWRHHRIARLDHVVSAVESSLQSDWRSSDRGVWFPVRHRVIAADRRNRFVIKLRCV